MVAAKTPSVANRMMLLNPDPAVYYMKLKKGIFF